MGIDDTVNLERIASALEKLASQFDRYNTLYEKRLDLEHPPEKTKRAPEIISTESEREAAVSDRATDEWVRETEAALPKSRFQERFDKAAPPARPAEPRRRRTVEVSKAN